MQSVKITITAESDGQTCTVSSVIEPPCPTVAPDAQRLFTAMIDTAARLVLGEMTRHASREAFRAEQEQLA